MGESMVAERIETWENNLPQYIKLAYLPAYGKLRLRLTAKGSDKDKLEKSISLEVEKLTNIINDIIIGFDEKETLEVMIGKLLTQKKATLAVAESCTGGNIAQKLTAIAGASQYFMGAIVAYNATIKINELSVKPTTLQKHSVVSAIVAEEMACGIQKKFNTTYAIATTGNAGPTADATHKTVGTVFVAIATPSTVFSKEYSFGSPRAKVIEKTTNKALEMLQKEILKN